MNKSESIKELATALAKAQAEIKGAVKDAHNPHFDYNYANLNSVWEAVRGSLTKNGLSIVQVPTETEKGLTLVTTLFHNSGEWISGEMAIKPTVANPQGIGSALSYARRYSLAAMVGVAQADDDGN